MTSATVNFYLPAKRVVRHGDLTFDVFDVQSSNRSNKQYQVFVQEYKGQRPKKKHFGFNREVNKTRAEFMAYIKSVLRVKNAKGEYVVNDINSPVYWNIRYCYNNKWAVGSVVVDNTEFIFSNTRFDIPDQLED